MVLIIFIVIVYFYFRRKRYNRRVISVRRPEERKPSVSKSIDLQIDQDSLTEKSEVEVDVFSTGSKGNDIYETDLHFLNGALYRWGVTQYTSTCVVPGVVKKTSKIRCHPITALDQF